MFPQDLLQDAMAILLFPIYNYPQHKLLRTLHMQTWAAKKFPDPSDEYGRFERLYEQLKRYIDDYISKATSSQLCYAYTHLPKFSNPELTKGAKLRPPPNSQLEFYHLSAIEKYRLLKTFLRLKLYSKIYYSTSMMRINPYTDETPCSACSWSWDFLNKLEGTTLTAYEREGFCCVAEYIRSLYGAI